MNIQALYAVRVTTTADAEDAVANLLSEASQQPVASYEDRETGRVTVTVFLKKRGDWNVASARKLNEGLKRIASCGLNIGAARISARNVPKDWAHSWKRHFKPLQIGGRLLIQPSWSSRKPVAGQELVILDPGLSFGTGQHPTTAFCLGELVRAAKKLPRDERSLFDVGTGSGILAISAAKLGYAPIKAIDYDEEAIRVSTANARRNRTSRRITFECADVLNLSKKGGMQYSVVCANLIADLLIRAADVLVSNVQSGGVLVLAGILAEEFKALHDHFVKMNVRLVRARTIGEWRSGAFVKC